MTVLLNLSAVLLALEECGEAASRCSEVLEMDPGNTTALLRRAKARAIRREFEVGLTTKARAIRRERVGEGLGMVWQRVRLGINMMQIAHSDQVPKQ